MDYSKIPVYGALIDWMDSNDIDYAPFVASTALILFFVGLWVFGVSGVEVFALAVALLPLWLPLLLFLVFFNVWTDAVGKKFALSQGRTTLRIDLPREIYKSPHAMETVLAQIHNVASPDNFMQTYLDGKRPLTYSLELVSLGGQVYFYANLPTRKTKDAFEANMYAQYPGIEIAEEPIDYAAEIPLDTAEHTIMSFHLGKKKSQVYPIKTYIDFGLDKMPKEEEKTDPLTPLLEVLASIAPHERVYVQILATPHRKRNFKHGQLVSKPTWEGEVESTISQMMQRDPKTRKPLSDANASGAENMPPRITPGERETIEAMERNMCKYAYETAIRFIYITPKGKFNGDLISPVLRSFSAYDIIGRNQVGPLWRTDFNYKQFTDPKEKKLSQLKYDEFKEYKLRTYTPQNGTADALKVFTVEELATIWHLPGSVAMTPGLGRIQSTRVEAPVNLPTAHHDTSS